MSWAHGHPMSQVRARCGNDTVRISPCDRVGGRVPRPTRHANVENDDSLSLSAAGHAWDNWDTVVPTSRNTAGEQISW